MAFRRFLGLGGSRDSGPGAANADSNAPLPVDASETETVRRIVGRLESMPPDRARLLASMAYVLARAAYADLDISDAETAEMERILVADANIDEAQAVLVVEMAKLQARTHGETEDYLVTREFRRASTPEQRLAVLRACWLVSAADEAITSTESATLDEIAAEFDLDRAEVAAVRAEFGDKLIARRLIARPRGA
ncbi:MAG TPA: TerB family tellurite resistance protein [Candidatus Limnocylindrales bacterium]|nr:TerB family tellurite resistance protein [Candidatus Limnocylindrales bacterium]